MEFRLILKCCAATVLVAGPGFAAPATASDFYKGKRVNFYVGYPAGSGYGKYGRLMGENIGRFIPGHPSIVIRSMPGAGGMRVMNYIYQVAPKDGTAWGAPSRVSATEPLLYGKRSRAAYTNPLEFNWIGSLNTETGVAAVWHTTKIDSWKDARAKPIIVAMASSHGGISARVLNALLGTKFEQVCCYGGGNNQNLAMERGEVQGRIGWSWSSLRASKLEWLKTGKIKLFMQIGLQKNPEIPGDVPLVMDLAKTDREKQALKIIFSSQSMGRPYVMPPGVPHARVEIVRDAFMTMAKDPAFLAQAAKHHLEINDPKRGDEIAALIKEVYASPKDAIAAARRAIKVGKIKIVRQPKKKRHKKRHKS